MTTGQPPRSSISLTFRHGATRSGFPPPAPWPVGETMTPCHGAGGRCGRLAGIRGRSSNAPRTAGRLRAIHSVSFAQRAVIRPLRQCVPQAPLTSTHRRLHDIVQKLPPSLISWLTFALAHFARFTRAAAWLLRSAVASQPTQTRHIRPSSASLRYAVRASLRQAPPSLIRHTEAPAQSARA